MNIKKLTALILGACLSLGIVFSGCTQKKEVAEKREILSSGGEVVFIDDEGNEITLKEPLKRIISLYSAHTENLFAIGAGDCLIGASKTSVYPFEAALLPRFDYKADPETVIASEPDAVLIRPFVSKKAPDFVEALKTAGIRVISLYPNSLDDFESYIQTLGAMTGKEEEAKLCLSEFWDSLEEIREKSSSIEDKKTIFFESTEKDLRTVTEGSLAGKAIELAGGINAAKGAKAVSETSSIASFGAEKLLEKADEIDVYVSQRGAMNTGGNEHSISIRPGFDTIKAIKEGKILLINEKLISSPTFRYVKGVSELARFMYPEAFDDLGEFENSQKPITRAELSEIIVKTTHAPIFAPSSSKYYNDILDGKEPKNHLYGLFSDVKTKNGKLNLSDFVETAVNLGAIDYEKGEKVADEISKDKFSPDSLATREDLAKAIFILGDLPASKGSVTISDGKDCTKEKIVLSVLENGFMDLENNCFNPLGEVSGQEAVNALRKIAL